MIQLQMIQHTKKHTMQYLKRDGHQYAARDTNLQQMSIPVFVEQFLKSEFSNDFSPDLLQIFKHAQTTRNTLEYDHAGIITHDDAVDLIDKADEFVRKAKQILNIP